MIGNPHSRRDRRADRRERAADRPGRSRVAPATDFFGFARTVGAPDIGAIESARERRPAPPPKTHARAKLVAVKVARGLHRIVVRVRTRNATRVTVDRAQRTGASSRRRTHGGSAGKGVQLRLTAPRHGKLVFRVRAIGPGGAGVRAVTVKARP